MAATLATPLAAGAAANEDHIDDVGAYVRECGVRARAASRAIARAVPGAKNDALLLAAELVLKRAESLRAANALDLDAGRANGLEPALLDRLELTPARLDAMAEGLRQVAGLPDPVGAINGMSYRPSGIQVGQMRVPLGVIAIIYESRPNVTADAAALCLKSGNATILRGGSEAIHSNRAIAACFREALERCGLPADAVQLIATTDRAAVGTLITMNDHVDVLVPRGGKGLIERLSREATVPLIKHLDGICHLYVDDLADLEKSVEVAFNAKTSRYGTCCTLETLLVHEAVAAEYLPQIAARYASESVEIRGCEATRAVLPQATPATEEDWDTEYLAPIISVRVVADVDAAMDHIARHGSAHTDSIMTEHHPRAMRFLREVDSASVMVNASTRFADGFEYGLGAEIGISTDKLHARGPVGLEGLTTRKFVVLGDGHIRV